MGHVQHFLALQLVSSSAGCGAGGGRTSMANQASGLNGTNAGTAVPRLWPCLAAPGAPLLGWLSIIALGCLA